MELVIVLNKYNDSFYVLDFNVGRFNGTLPFCFNGVRIVSCNYYPINVAHTRKRFSKRSPCGKKLRTLNHVYSLCFQNRSITSRANYDTAV